MKNTILKATVLVTFFALFASCSKSNDDNGINPAPNPGASLGTFAGNIQVSNDPQTNLGYVYNAIATVSKSGTEATIKVTGNEGFDRVYTGTVMVSSGTNTFIEIKKQTKPVDKIASGNCGISGNGLTMDVSLANDAVTVKKTATSTTTISIEGKITMIGTNFIRQ
jgi:hypothetical protein